MVMCGISAMERLLSLRSLARDHRAAVNRLQGGSSRTGPIDYVKNKKDVADK